MSIARGLGNPVGVDKHTLSREYGYFAQVLVEIDLASPIPKKICEEEDADKSFLKEVVVGKLPKFCPHCRIVRHLMVECKGQAYGISNEGEHAGCAIRCTKVSPNLQIVVVTENEPIASLQSLKNTFRVLNETNSLLASTNWEYMAEEEEETGKKWA
ncbi:hypothetical protein IFM89_027770 [Coptis chinensis]|uniref:Uncharacterized protein n=1 Tax=Coptis chinensis TaxID=261450 RepID=A0A835I415_9MAGN|nr:hypothetical protein IFM89_027770 [Coptis chinensis]